MHLAPVAEQWADEGLLLSKNRRQRPIEMWARVLTKATCDVATNGDQALAVQESGSILGTMSVRPYVLPHFTTRAKRLGRLGADRSVGGLEGTDRPILARVIVVPSTPDARKGSQATAIGCAATPPPPRL